MARKQDLLLGGKHLEPLRFPQCVNNNVYGAGGDQVPASETEKRAVAEHDHLSMLPRRAQ